ncbi:peptidase U35 [Acinetobacter sp. ANC 4204]|uniref:HK97 family phage prohead protease n=1 Tax=Acinetobacter sp. ANC 4204 TaxID=1977884 RepID=UPI000A331112|nr:HK97 family phage prohead protease [Acinetobacter sp. ANC 4204]OTG58881.1 peptidase U35 [Acinetobacter sp. ANC 4204]
MNQNLQVRNKALPILPKVQCRRLPVKLEARDIKRDPKTGVLRITGYAVKWDSVNHYGEKFIRGAFAEVCAAFAAGTKKVHAYYNHGWRMWFLDSFMAMRIGKYLRLEEDDQGLLVELEFTPNMQWSQTIAAMVEHGTVDGFSIAFYPPSPMDMEDKGTHVEIKRADLYEISVVDEPADDAARVISEDSINGLESSSDAVELLRSLGLHGEYADKLISRLNEFSKPQETPAPEPKKDPFAFLDSSGV